MALQPSYPYLSLPVHLGKHLAALIPREPFVRGRGVYQQRLAFALETMRERNTSVICISLCRRLRPVILSGGSGRKQACFFSANTTVVLVTLSTSPCQEQIKDFDGSVDGSDNPVSEKTAPSLPAVIPFECHWVISPRRLNFPF